MTEKNECVSLTLKRQKAKEWTLPERSDEDGEEGEEKEVEAREKRNGV